MSAIPRSFTLLGTGAGGTPTFNGWTSTGTGVFTSAATGGLQLYNTADQTTNYERLALNWSGNVATLSSTQGGSGTQRSLSMSAGNTSILFAGTGSTKMTINPASSSAASTLAIAAGAGFTNSATSGTNIFLSLTPTYNQASGTAANTDLLINRTQTAVGSGQQLLIDAQVGGTSQFYVSNTGSVVTSAGGLYGSNGRGFIRFNSDGVLQLSNNAGSDFSRLQFGGTTSSFPAIKRSGAGLQVRLADDSTYGDLAASFYYFSPGTSIRSGAGSPEGVVTAPAGSLFARTDGGAATTLYVKESGAGNTGWVAK